jgi:hypothetical protein
MKGTMLDLSPKSAVKLGGLLLPNIFITNSDSLPASLIGVDAFTLAELDNYPNLKGMVVYNSNPDLAGGEGLFVWNGSKWEKTGSDSGFKSECDYPAMDAAGGDLTCSVADEFCSVDADYSFSLLAGGGDFCTLTVVDARKGKFTLSFDHNPTAETRKVIVLVTSPCGDTHTFVYSQEGDDSGCGSTLIAPKILGENTTDLCAGGAVYLYLQGRPSGTYIWARNGVQVGTGTDYVATQAGIYIVYADLLGCTHVKPDTVHVTALSTSAPDAPVVVAENNGALCSAGGTVNVYAVFQGSGNVVWYHNGVRQTALSGNVIAAGEGEWFAVIEDGGCSSVQSNSVSVYLDANAGGAGITPPSIEINGVSVGGSVALCRGGTPTFRVVAPQAGETYTWYRNNTSIGTGESLTYSITSDDAFILRCRATSVAKCPQETDIVVSVSTTRPAMPSISCNTVNAICDGTATLTANHSGTASSYLWYRSDTETGTYTQIAGESSQSLVISRTGYYKVQTQDGICRSAMSAAKNIAAVSGAANVVIKGKKENIHAGFTVTYTAEMDNPQGETYQWSVEPGTTNASPTSGTGNPFAVHFADVGTATVSLSASNACGTATVTDNNFNIDVDAACVSVSINGYTPSSKTASLTVGGAAMLSITAAGSPTLTYQWYSTTSDTDNTGGTLISSATSATYKTDPTLAEGTYYYYCETVSSCDNSTTTSDVFTVTVDPSPATLSTGTGALSGRICFDVAQSNDGDACGTLANRQNETLTANGIRADFTNAITNTQTYTFQPSGTVSNVRFAYIEATAYAGQIIQSISGGNAGNSISSAVTCTVVYESGLNTEAAGKTADEALTVDIYAIYNDAADGTGTNKTVKLTASIRDCYCCPGLLIPGGEYEDNGASTAPETSWPTVTGASSVNISRLRSSGLFRATGKDLCIYYRDYHTDGGTYYVNYSANYCTSTDYYGVDKKHASSAWRLPVLMELAQVGELMSNINVTTSHTTTMTQAQVNTAMNYAAGNLPAGSTISSATSFYAFLCSTGFWSSTKHYKGSYFVWDYDPSARFPTRGTYNANYGYRALVRCVRSL